MRHWILNQRGNVLIMSALVVAVLAGFGILTIDIGRMLVTRTQLQNAADAGALAGASLFCAQGTPELGDIQSEVRLVGGSNRAMEDTQVLVDIPNSQIGVSFPDREVTVTTRSNTRQFFSGLFALLRPADPRNPGQRVGVSAVATARCGATCGVNCVKPWSIPDRWDDVTPIQGYTGGGRGGSARPNWQNNQHWDTEAFTDQNGNGLRDAGEPFVDGNGNGRYDAEAYHPLLTGYIPDPYPGNYLTSTGDLGFSLVLHPYQGGSATPEPGQYYSVDLPPVNKGTPITGGDEYRENIANCNPVVVEKGDWLQLEPGAMVGPTNQGMRDLIAQDPDATWDDATGTVQNSRFPISPRIVLIPIHDPRIPIQSGRNMVQVTKVAAFFMERMVGSAEVRGRFIKVRGPGVPCNAGEAAGSFTYNLSLIR